MKLNKAPALYSRGLRFDS